MDETQPLLQQDVKRLTLGQTVFNMVNLIMGLGFLALPFCFYVSGWLFGSITFLIVLFMMNWSARLVEKSLTHHKGPSTIPPKPLTSFPDLADEAFGGYIPRNAIAGLFMTELLVAMTAILIVASDNLNVFLHKPAWIIKCCVAGVMWLTTFATLKTLSFTSFLGMMASSWIVFTVVVDGLLTMESPGSLIHPAPTQLLPHSWLRAWLAPSVFLGCLSGHAVLPSLHLVMKDRKQFVNAINRAFLVIGSLYLIVSICGYLSYGPETLDQVTKNIAQFTQRDAFTRSDSIKKVVTQIAICFMVLIPLTKFGLLAEPVAQHLCRNIVRDVPHWFSKGKVPIYISEDQVDADDWRDPRPPWQTGTLVYDSTEEVEVPVSPQPRMEVVPMGLIVLVKTMLTGLCLGVAILVPEFVGLVAIMGAALSCTTSVLFPCWVYLKLYSGSTSEARWKRTVTWIVFFLGIVFAILGTIVGIREAIV